MKKTKAVMSVLLCVALMFTSLTFMGAQDTQAASYPKIPALPISRVYQPYYDENGLCYWSSMATVQGYCLGTYTYGGVTTNYRVGGKDYNYLDRSDAITKLFKDSANGVANNYNNLTKYYPVKMTRITDGIGKNTSTYQQIYNQLAQGKPVIVYTGTHASVVIAYNGSTTTLQPSGFTVMEIKKDKTSSGMYWWTNSETYYNNHANSPMIDSKSLSTNGKSYMCCYVNLESWISYCGDKLQEICYPTNAVSTDFTFNFNANGGTGTMPSVKAALNENVVFPECGFEKDGYYCAGYFAQRKSDSKWHVSGVGWRTISEIRNQGLDRSVYQEGLSFTMNSSWYKEGGIVGDTFTLYPVWLPTSTTLDFYGNTSGTNYMMSINSDTFEEYYQSRNTDIYTLSTQEFDGFTALKIVGSKAGDGNVNDMLFKTQTNEGLAVEGQNYDEKEMTLTFKAKSSVDGAKLYFRWGFISDVQSVTLSQNWETYTVQMSKNKYSGIHIHPYIDTAGTFYIADISLTDSGAVVPTEEETSDLLYSRTFTVGKTYDQFPTPRREGYTFLGWYTAKEGGEKVSLGDAVLSLNTNVYARWEKSSALLLMGDADLSGGITVKDATAVQKHLAGIATLSSKASLAGNVYTADVLNIKDATAIQKWCAGIDTGDAVVGEYISYT